MRALETRYGRAALVDALRAETAALRERLASGHVARGHGRRSGRRDRARRRRAAARGDAAVARRASSTRPASSSTPTSAARRCPRRRWRASATVAGGYTNLEYDLDARRARTPRRARRDSCSRVSPAPKPRVVVNNNAAATLLLLAALAAGREVIISRGELVEIGGGFRVPDVMAQSGAILREVGTTNRTRAADYAAAIGERTALILRVHPSNFRVVGFTERPSLDELVALGRRFNVPVVEDLGSGWLGWPERDRAARAAARRADRLGERRGGRRRRLLQRRQAARRPAGRASSRDAAPLVDAIRRHPLMRALRVDKLTYAALEATLEEHAIGRGRDGVPVQRMLRDGRRTRSAARADALAAALDARRLDGARRSTACPPSAAAAPRASSCRRGSSQLERDGSTAPTQIEQRSCGRSTRRSSPASRTIASSST